MDLQRLAGNTVVCRLLGVSRQQAATAVTTAAGPLTQAQVRDAIAWYSAQPARYTRDIIMEIQMEVGTTPTGRMEAVDVQAVARRQEALNVPDEPRLKVDGKAGPRTLPSIFKFGLSEDRSVGDYTRNARAMWDGRGGRSEESVAREIVNSLVNKRFDDLGIPHIDFTVVTLGTRGAFSSGDWKLSLDPLQFRPGKFHDVRDTTATIYHEARHAEQSFRIGQLLARQRKTAEQINARTGLKQEIAEVAIARKNDLTPMQVLIAQGWFDSEFGAAALEQRRRNGDELRASFSAREAACEAFKRAPTVENRARLVSARARFSRAVDEHDDLPHEFDAERLEAKVKRSFGSAEVHDDPCAIP
jgi:hypothetical protein